MTALGYVLAIVCAAGWYRDRKRAWQLVGTCRTANETTQRMIEAAADWRLEAREWKEAAATWEAASLVWQAVALGPMRPDLAGSLN